jgi:hypothetical protein
MGRDSVIGTEAHISLMATLPSISAKVARESGRTDARTTPIVLTLAMKPLALREKIRIRHGERQ